jgi:quercetin dioxygenase-like cupin family protein
VFAEIGDLAPQRIWEGVVARSVHTDRLTMGLIELAPDAVVPEHHHDNEQVGILLDGSMTFTVGGDEREVRAGSTWAIPPDVPHSVVAGPAGAVAFEIFAPGRDDWRPLERDEPTPPRWPPGG